MDEEACEKNEVEAEVREYMAGDRGGGGWLQRGSGRGQPHTWRSEARCSGTVGGKEDDGGEGGERDKEVGAEVAEEDGGVIVRGAGHWRG